MAGSDTPRGNFIRDIIDDDLAAGRYGGRVVTRFPPEPNGWLHIGHAKSICLNFGLARDYRGACNLRFDDTNPLKEDTSYVEAIERDVAWLGFTWDGPVRFASDYFAEMYACAVRLIERGDAYVDSQSADEISATRGTPAEPGRDSPHRTRSIAENLDLFSRMRAGEFPDGSHVLRAKIDMASPNLLMRDPPLYRIRHARHHRTGDAWCIYPMYDFAHCLEDAFEGVSHSICTLEFEQNRPLYDWVLDRAGPWERRPRQIEFARLNLTYTVLSKRHLLRLVTDKLVEGWDDPRMPTIAGLRRRGVTPEALRAFCDLIGVAKANSTVDLGKLEFCLREDLNARAPRAMCVLRPLKVVITNWPAGEVETIDAPWWPADIGKPGRRPVPLGREIWIERDDFSDDPPKEWHRLAPGRAVRLRYAYVIRCNDVVRDAAGAVTELRCSYDPATRHGAAGQARVKGTIHWVSAAHAKPVEVRLYDRLFSTERPGTTEGVDFISELNPRSIERVTAMAEPALAAAEPESRWQFERQGYFFADPSDSAFNRIVTLRDSWAKIASPRAAVPRAATPAPAVATPAGTVADDRAVARTADPRLAERFARYTAELEVDPADADRLTGDLALATFFDAAVAAHGRAPIVARWIVNELSRELKDRRIDALPFSGADFGALVELVDTGTISATAGKDVLTAMLAGGGGPHAIVQARGLAQVSDAGALEPAVDRVIAAHPDEAARYRAGKTQLLGFFVKQVLAATGGAANPQRARALIEKKLAG